ncbi:MAG: nucleotide exchange factor GrpE [Longicatena sp.]|uniref:nucleotide exchange factor GrpE n=1 Tax=Anaerorhabdus sp. TaxID=1872524 RepID=UPI002FCAF180
MSEEKDVVQEEQTCECEKECTAKEEVKKDVEQKETPKENSETTKETKKSSKFGKNKKIEELEEEVIQLKEEIAASKNAYFKAYADAENLKKRLQSESDNVRKYRIQSFAMEVLPIIDNLERALKVQSDDENIKNYVKGFEMIYQQLLSTLEKEGVKEIEALEQPFDPNIHQALMQEVVDGVESGIVVEVLQKGYMLKDRVLRATLVKVSE